MSENGKISQFVNKLGFKSKTPASQERADVGEVKQQLPDATRQQPLPEKNVPSETKILSHEGETYLRLRADTENPIQITLGADPNRTDLQALANSKTLELHARREGESISYYLTDAQQQGTEFDIPNDGQPYPVGRLNPLLFPNGGSWISREHLSLTPRGDVIDIAHQSQTNPTYIKAPQADFVRPMTPKQ